MDLMDYSKITADPVRGPEIGRMFVDASPFITTLAKVAYGQMADQVAAQFTELRKRVRVQFQESDPYTCAAEMFADVAGGWLRVWGTTSAQSHPILTPHQNNMFRAVHDYYGHFMTGRDFSRHGEEAAWVRHSRMFTGLARRAMTTETRGQHSAFIWVNGGREFPEQKAVLLPDWVSEIPERWAS
jgi:hypothetical protein